MFIDTHTHLYAGQFDEDREQVVHAALYQGVERMYLPNIDQESIEPMLTLEKAFPDHCFAMMGLHPCSVKENFEEELTTVRSWLERRSFKAIGEIGIDLYWDKTFVKEQEIAFLRQVDWAMEFDLPIVIHSRESIDDILALLEPRKEAKLRGIFHCFDGSIEQAKQIMEMGTFQIGIGGIVTYRKDVQAVVAEIPLEYIV
ncbi:MAG: TatD family hydrolase, partial [Bacteroidota bacterium]